MENVKTQMRVVEAWRLARPTLERRAVQIQRRRGCKLYDAVNRVLRKDPALWRVYQRAMLAGCTSEFQTPKRPPSTPRQRAWQKIERAARKMVATSAQPMNLGDAAIAVVRKHPAWYQAYRRMKK